MTESKTIGSVRCSDGDYPNMWVSTADCATSLIGKLFEKYADEDTLIITTEFEHENVRDRYLPKYQNVFKLNVKEFETGDLSRLVSLIKTMKPTKVFVYMIGTRVTSGYIMSQSILSHVKQILTKKNIPHVFCLDACQEICKIRDYSLFDHIIFTAHSALMYFDLGILYSKENPNFECDWERYCEFVEKKKQLIDSNVDLLLFNVRMKNILSEELERFGNQVVNDSVPWFFTIKVDHTKISFTETMFKALDTVGVRIVGTESIKDQLRDNGRAFYQIKMRAQHYVIHPEHFQIAIELLKILLGSK